MRIQLRVPLSAISNFETTESSVNYQIADIIETFDYNLIPNGASIYKPKLRASKQLTLTAPRISIDRFNKYCQLTGKSRTVVMAQMLMAVGKYKVE